MILAPKIITGFLHSQNKGACDWGWQGAIAYGCHNFVVVIETKTVQVYQVLDKHKATVIKVKWARENYHHDTGSPYSLRLASGDTNGGIVIWDVAQGREKIEFSDGNKPIQDMEWLPSQDASHDLLLVLHPPYSLILWNADTGTKLWKKSYTESLLSFSLDPFSYRNIAFLGQDCILFIDDFSITKTPSSNGKKFYISSPSASKGDTPSNTLERKSSSSSKNLAKRMTKILVGEGKQREDENIALNECIQLAYHKACRHHLILVYAREILILDLEINQTVGTIPMERTGSPFLEVIPMHQRDVLFCLHENGSITCRVRRRNNSLAMSYHEGLIGGFDESPPGPFPDISYDLRCQSDSIRMTRHCKVTGVVCCPVTEKTLALILSDSRVIFWEMHTVDFQEGNSHSLISPLYTPGSSQYTLAESQASDTTVVSNQLTGTASLPLVTSIPPPKMALGDMIGQSQVLSPDTESASKGHGVSLKFLMTGLLNGLNAPITVIRMCPPLTTKNLKEYSPLLAVGSQTGKIQIIHLGSGHTEREYSLHTSIVRGIEWASLKSFMSYSYPNPGGSNQVKNEIFLMDITSGKATAIRTHRDQESPINMIRISHNKQYFLVSFKDKPLELWDLKSLTLLRGMSHKLPYPTALEWSPSPGLKALKRKLQQQQLLQQQQQQQAEQQGTSDATDEGSSQGGTKALEGTSSLSTSISASSSSASINGTGESQPNILAKEHFIYTDSDGTLYHFAVEGNGFVDASKIPSESGMGTITWVAWKADYLVFGDADGQLCVWDLRAKTSRTNSTHRGWIKKIRFAPGRSHFKFLILYNDGMDIWDLKEGKPELVSSIKSPREIAKVIDAEWAGSDRPVLVTTDGCVHMYDMSLKKTNCTIEERDNQERTFEPYVVPQKVAFLSKLLLQHQRWSSEYQLKLTELGGGGEEEEEKVVSMVNFQLKNIDSELASYLPTCRFGTAERCLLTARLFGDESEVRFWTIALHYLRAEKAQPVSKDSSAIFSKQEEGDIFRPQMSDSRDSCILDLNIEDKDGGSSWLPFKDQPLEKCYDFLCDNQSYKKYQLDRVALHDSKRPTHEHTRKCAENLIMLGQTDRAVQLLLETEPDTDPYYLDCLRACLVASIRSSGASQSTIKLVATNLIASGKLQEGVQLLCLIDKGLDACRYLQTYGAWEQAVWLAKSTLDYNESCEVMKRWVDHLCSTQVNQKSTAVLVMLSLGQFYKALEMLYGMRQFNRATCFIEAAMEFGLLEKSTETGPLIEAVFLEYARILLNLGHKKGAVYYCNQAGDKGKQLLKEVEFLFPSGV